MDAVAPFWLAVLPVIEPVELHKEISSPPLHEASLAPRSVPRRVRGKTARCRRIVLAAFAEIGSTVVGAITLRATFDSHDC